MSSRAVAYLHQPRFRRPHGQLRSAPPSRRRRRCRHPPSRMKSWAVAGPLHPCGRATGVQLRLQPGRDPHRQPGGAVRGNDRGQRLHGRQSHRIRRRAPPARCTAVGPSGGARADARGTSAASTIVRGRSWEIPTTPADARPTSSHRRWSRAGRGAEKAGWWPGLLAVLPLAGWSSHGRRRPSTAPTRTLARS